MTVIAHHLVVRELADAQSSGYALQGLLRDVRASDADVAGLRPKLALVSVQLDMFSGGIRTSFEAAAGPSADVASDGPHEALAKMRREMQSEAERLLSGAGSPQSFWPNAEQSIERVLADAAVSIEELAGETAARATEIRMRAFS